jgi:hypothetical protein
MTKTVASFKQDFYARVPDLSLFDCMEFNLVKVVVEGLKLDYVSNGKIAFHHLKSYGSFYRWAKSLYKKRKDSKYTQKKEFFEQNIAGKKYDYLLLDVGRFVKNKEGAIVSSYFKNIHDYFLENKLNHLFMADKCLNEAIHYDLKGEDYFDMWTLTPLDAEEKELLKNLNLTIDRIAKSGLFSEKDMQNIMASCIEFFLQFRFWHYFLSQTSFSKIIFICNYYKEGFQLACRRKGVITAELQHGLIAKEHLFYMYSEHIKEVRSRALFPDMIYTFGKFWTERLLSAHEFLPNQIVDLGYYMHVNSQLLPEQKKQIDDLTKGKTKIFVPTQHTSHPPYIEYIKWLSNDIKQRGQNAFILVKLHPSEKIELYKEIQGLENVAILNINLDAILSYVDMIIGIYSTTLYDASRYGVKRFCLNAPEYRDFVESFIASGIAQQLEMNENPLDKTTTNLEVEPEYFYGKPNYSQLLS